jgi:uncharacterized membrane protein YphA (DoxX/SURF4 family)
MNELNITVAVLTVRIIAGSLFVFQGYDKLFNVGMDQLSATMKASLQPIRLSGKMVRLVAFSTSWVEFLCGILLIAGLFTPYVTWLLCADLIIVSIGFGLARPMWDTTHVMTRLILLVFLLLCPPSIHTISIDALLGI